MPRSESETGSFVTFDQVRSIVEYLSSLEDIIVFGSFPRCVLSGDTIYNDIDILATGEYPYSQIIDALLGIFSPSIRNKSITIQQKENDGEEYRVRMGMNNPVTISFELIPYNNIVLDIVRPTGYGYPHTLGEDYIKEMYNRGDISANFCYIKDGEYLGIGTAVNDAKEKKIRVLEGFTTKRLGKTYALLSNGWKFVPSKED